MPLPRYLSQAGQRQLRKEKMSAPTTARTTTGPTTFGDTPGSTTRFFSSVRNEKARTTATSGTARRIWRFRLSANCRLNVAFCSSVYSMSPPPYRLVRRMPGNLDAQQSSERQNHDERHCEKSHGEKGRASSWSIPWGVQGSQDLVHRNHETRCHHSGKEGPDGQRCEHAS